MDLQIAPTIRTDHAGTGKTHGESCAIANGAVPGPWVLVVGMHRSGTSAISGLFAALGLHEPAGEDLMAHEPDNPNHHESRSMSNVSQAVLEALGGSWDLPPTLELGWNRAEAVAALLPRAIQAAMSAYPMDGPRVFKDPRTALILPFWCRVLNGPLPAVLIWRSPAAVTRSLVRRDNSLKRHYKLSFTQAAALWHYYNHAALTALAGHDVFVLGYEELVRQPDRIAWEIREWLDRLGICPPDGGWRTTEAARSVVRELAHEASDHNHLGLASGLDDYLTELRGPHQSLTPGTPPEMPAWVFDTLDDRRTLAASHQANQRLEAEVAALSEGCDRSGREVDSLRAQLVATEAELAAVYRSRSWRASAPLRAVSDVVRHQRRSA